MQNIDKISPDIRTITLPKHSQITNDLLQNLDHLLSFASPGELRDSLLEVYHHYLIARHDSLPLNFRRIAENLYMLIDFLNSAARVGEVEE